VIDDYRIFYAGCLSVVIGASEEDVIEAFGLDRARVAVVTGKEAFELQRPGSEVVVQVARLGDAIVTFEPNGYEGSKHALATALSARGRYVSYYEGATAVTEFIYAEGGALLRSFEPLLYGSDGEPARALPVEEGLPFDRFEADGQTAKTGRSCLMLIERLTGIQISRQWLLDKPRATYCRAGEAPWPENT
jgi:hypothetical protein